MVSIVMLIIADIDVAVFDRITVVLPSAYRCFYKKIAMQRRTPSIYHAGYLDRERRGVDELGHLAENTLVPVLKERGVIRGYRVHGQIVPGSSPRSACHIGLVEHVLVPAI